MGVSFTFYKVRRNYFVTKFPGPPWSRTIFFVPL